MTMTSEARSKLSKTIRALRERLMIELGEATDREYRLSVRTKDTKLNAATKARRKRLEEWLAEQVRGETGKQKRTRGDFRRDVEKQAAYTLLNRLVILRIMEATRLRSPLVVTGGWNSRGYKDFRELAPALVRNDDSEGYSFLLQLIFEDLATDLPGLYGSAGIADLIPVPSATIRAVVEAFDDPELKTCWTDDMTLGWIYQYWNDPEREALDAKINDGGKIEPHEIASKTQMFTERYMVDWLLQNSLGPMWLAMCQKHGWTPAAEADGTLDRLEQRRVEWRAKRDAGEVELTELMPLETEAERRWAYFVPQPIPDDAVEHAPQSVRDLKILDPAVGSGHFLVVAFDLLFALYQEEARHRGETDDEDWSDAAIVERILEHNLHGIDLDPRAVQIAAAALWLKAQQVCPEAQPRQLNLVASNLEIASLPDNDPALVELRQAIEDETGIPAKLTNQIIDALRGADHLGSLLKVDVAIEAAIDEYEQSLDWDNNVKQLQFFSDGRIEQQKFAFQREQLQIDVLAALEMFLSRHTSARELGLRLHGEQLAAGVRFLRMVREDTYDLVVANPPYQGTSKLTSKKYVESEYKLGKADLFAAFLLRGLELVREHGVSAMLTMRNWMFIKQYSKLREHLLEDYDLRALGDFDRGAFEDIPDEVVAVCVAVFSKSRVNPQAIAQCPTPREDTSRDSLRTQRKRAATLCHVGRHDFDPAVLNVIPEWPLVYWWSESLLGEYTQYSTIGKRSPAKKGVCTSDNVRFIRFPWEVFVDKVEGDGPVQLADWIPYVMGSSGRQWCEGVNNVLYWRTHGLSAKLLNEKLYGSYSRCIQNQHLYFKVGIAFTTIGSGFSGRAYQQPSVFDTTGCSVFPEDIDSTLCLFNSKKAKWILQSLNPTVHFTNGDVNRLPCFEQPDARRIVQNVNIVFQRHEQHREPSVSFRRPGPSPWQHAQEWAQQAVDRSDDEPLPEYIEQLAPEPPADHLSFAVGVAFGRFGPNGEGILDPATHDLAHALPHGILFLDGTLSDDDQTDSLGNAAAQIIHDKWDEQCSQIDARRGLREWLREKFFKDVHRQMYENRPIHWPLSSAKRTFVAWVNIHRWDGQTLRVLLADHLQPTLTRLDGEIDDLTTARGSSDKKEARAAEGRYDDVKAWRDELADFIAAVEQCADKGPAPAQPNKPEREADARYVPDLDDGVMINSAALWPLLEPQWKDPKKWWKELVAAKGKKDYDWSHLAMRYWPTRVDKKCQNDPSLGVAHGCFWKYHPAKAWAWELRLQDEIAPDFHIEEAPYRGDGGDVVHREAYLRDEPSAALQAVEKEALRRIRKHGQPQPELTLLEPGLWSKIPQTCWDLELKLTKKQESEFRLIAPDEPQARAEFEEKNPEQVKVRDELLSKLKPLTLFADAADEEGVA